MSNAIHAFSILELVSEGELKPCCDPHEPVSEGDTVLPEGEPLSKVTCEQCKKVLWGPKIYVSGKRVQ